MFQFNNIKYTYYFYLLITLIPINIVSVIMVLFTEMKFYSLFLYTVMVFFSWIFIFFISFSASVVSKSIRLSDNRLFKLQYNLNVRKNIRIKLKLMFFIEKLVNNKRLFGFSVSTFFVMSQPILYKVRNFR